jgi:ABC-type lipopolysaccharide export system ATPase subunit
MYTAELKREISEPLADKRAAVDELLKRLALDTCRDVKIGNQMARGISGGQAKRTNIGIALITNPKVIFLDEPTSGALVFALLMQRREAKKSRKRPTDLRRSRSPRHHAQAWTRTPPIRS